MYLFVSTYLQIDFLVKKLNLTLKFPKFSPAAQKMEEIWLKDLQNSQKFH
uniref:Uncharacterized protein n=1 Tax=Meloidogyne enterolobii TaxID=390850 RepID=A0A6V7TWQ5_MELEN|nr:unnamed protein product [Meloidogyne enterolobii]